LDGNVTSRLRSPRPAQVKRLRAAGAEEVWRETASAAKSDRVQLRRVLAQLGSGDVLLVTRLDRLARSTRDLLSILAAIAEKRAGFRSLGDSWADTTTAHGRLMLTVLGGLAEFERGYERRCRRKQQYAPAAVRQRKKQQQAERNAEEPMASHAFQ
jgi:DNA invertase Pin-like site-specific DNA recombinase